MVTCGTNTTILVKNDIKNKLKYTENNISC